MSYSYFTYQQSQIEKTSVAVWKDMCPIIILNHFSYLIEPNLGHEDQEQENMQGAENGDLLGLRNAVFGVLLLESACEGVFQAR